MAFAMTFQALATAPLRPYVHKRSVIRSGSIPVRSGRKEVRMTTTDRIDSLRTRHAGLHAKLEDRSEEHTSELQSLMRISYAVFCLKKKIYLNCTMILINKDNTI